MTTPGKPYILVPITADENSGFCSEAEDVECWKRATWRLKAPDGTVTLLCDIHANALHDAAPAAAAEPQLHNYDVEFNGWLATRARAVNAVVAIELAVEDLTALGYTGILLSTVTAVTIVKEQYPA